MAAIRAAAIGVATQAAAPVAEEATAMTAAARRAAIVARNLTADGAGHHLVAGDAFFVGHADANRTGGLARNLAGFVHGALLDAFLFDALIGANFALLFTPFLLANRNLHASRDAVSNLLADGVRAAFVFRAVNPDFAGGTGLQQVLHGSQQSLQPWPPKNECASRHSQWPRRTSFFL